MLRGLFIKWGSHFASDLKPRVVFFSFENFYLIKLMMDWFDHGFYEYYFDFLEIEKLIVAQSFPPFGEVVLLLLKLTLERE